MPRWGGSWGSIRGLAASLCRVLCAQRLPARPIPPPSILTLSLPPRALSAAPAGRSERPTARLARACIILISPRMRASFEAGARSALLHPFSNLPVFETAKPAVRRN